MRDSATSAAEREDTFQSGADFENSQVKTEALDMAATYHDDGTMSEMFLDRLSDTYAGAVDEYDYEIDHAVKLLFQHCVQGNKEFPCWFVDMADKVAVQRFESKALDRVRNRELE